MSERRSVSRTRVLVQLAAASTSLLLTLAAATAQADLTKDQCVDANGKAQDARREGRFGDARALLQSCANASCPKMVANDCTARLDDLDRAQPSVLFDARDAAGNDLSAVKVTVDGRPLTDKLTGLALSVDPGHHTFTFEAQGLPVVTQELVVSEREQGRQVTVVLGKPAAETAPAPDQAPPHGISRRTIGLVVGGVGVGAVITGAVFGLLASSATSDYEKHCGSNIHEAPNVCDSTGVSGHDDASTKAALSTGFFIGGGVLAAAGAVLWFTGAPGKPSASAALTPGGVIVRGEF
jgi:hypothetical protein